MIRASHIPALDGLRGLAVLLVVWCHVPPNLAGYPGWLAAGSWLLMPGNLGVELFFVLSGFLITRILIAERAVDAPVRWFLLRRMVRIFPIYYLLLAVMWFVRPTEEIAWCAAYLSNVSAATIGVPRGPLEHTWSLCIEEHFYLAWPLVVAWCSETARRRSLVCVVLPLSLATMLGAVLVAPHSAAEFVDRFTVCRFGGLAVGALLAEFEPRVVGGRLRWVLLAALVLVLAVHPHVLYLFGPHWLGSREAWLPFAVAPVVWRLHTTALCALLVVAAIRSGAAVGLPGLFGRALQARWLRGVGRISYALYLYHLPIFHWLADGGTLGDYGFAILVSLIAAIASYFVVERPLQGFGSRLRAAPIRDRAEPVPSHRQLH